MSSCDCESPSCFTRTTPRARKPHVCDECGENIPVGEVHERLTGVWDGRPDSFRLHLTCEEWRRALENHVREEARAERSRLDAAERAFHASGKKPEEGRVYIAAQRALRYDGLCDCIAIGGLREAMRELCVEVHGYDPRPAKERAA